MKIPSMRSLRRTVLIASTVATLLRPEASQADEFRALWVDAFGSGFLTAAEVTTLVNHCTTYNFNAVVVQMRRRGDAFYIPQAPNGDPRTTAVASGFDALQDVINKCHAATPPIEVHCWVAGNLIWGTAGTPSQPGHVFNLHPEYLSRNSSGATLLEDGYWLDPGHPAAMQWNYNMAKDIVSRYDIDGFHWDRCRYPSENSGYNAVAIARYNAEFGLTGQPASNNSQFKTWRRRQMTDFIRWTSADLMEIKPALQISASVFANRTDALNFRFQDWAAWANEGIIDFLLPMNYTADNATFSSRMTDIVNNQGVRRSYMGLGAYLNTKENTVTQLNMVRSKPMLGAALYSYRSANSGTINQTATFQHIRDNFQPTYEPTPVLPWIATPTKGVVKGTVSRQDNGDPIYNATVTVTGTQRTEPHGKYAFFELTPGTYTAIASSSGFTSAPVNVTVVAGGIHNVDITIDLPATGDITAPTITAVTSTSVSSNSAVITWRTDEPASSTVQYGVTTAYGSSTNLPVLVTNHSVTVNGLAANSTYHFRVRSSDDAGNESVSDNFQFTTTPSQPDIIIDNPAAVVSGSWTLATSATDKFGADYRNRTFGSGGSLLYTPNIQIPGHYQVYEWHTQGANRATNTPVIVTHSAGVTTNRVNQQINGGQWVLVGTFFFNAGTGGNIRISDLATGPASAQVIADAVKLTYLPDTISDPIIVDNPQAVTNGAWTLATSATDKFGADYRNRTFGTGANSVLYTPFLPVPGTYQVYEWHPQGSNRATNTPHVVTFNGGVTTNFVNQQVNGGKWNLLGAYRFNAGSSGSLRVRDNATGPASAQVMADAMRWVFLPPPVPGDVIATTISSSQINVAWVDNSTDEANFTVWRGTNSGGPYTLVATLPANATAFSDTGLSAETTYYYAVRATTGPGGASAFSNEANATTLPPAPAAPAGLTATAISSSAIDLAWTDNNEDLDTAYGVFRSLSASGPFDSVGTVESRVQAFNDTGLSPNTTYYYVVRASNAGGSSPDSNLASATTDSDVPAAPTDLVGVAVSANQIDLSWVNNASNADSIAVVRAEMGGGYSTIATLPASATAYSDTSVSGHTTYFYYLRVANGSGNTVSAAVQVTTPNSDPVANAGGDQTASANHDCQATFILDGTASADADLDTLTYTWSGSFGTTNGPTPAVTLGLGAHVITLTVDDGNGGTATTTVTLTVEDTTAPEFALNGVDPMTVECHNEFVDPGATALDDCAGDLTSLVVISGSVDANTPGSYTLTYTVTDPSGNVASVTRTVNVVDTTAPTVTLNGSISVTVECHGSFADEGATASDLCAGDLTAGIVVSGSVDANTPGTYTLTYAVTDASGNTASASRTVIVVDRTPPALSLNGAASMTLTSHEPFVDPGATASDVCAGDLTASIVVSGTVDSDVLGTYILTYTVTDPSGNSSTAIRTVNVVDTSAPTLTLNGASSMTIECHSVFVDPGATATDDYAGDLTSAIIVTGAVDANTTGNYTLTYTVSDPSGNTVSAIRTVQVVDTTAPTLTLNGASSMTVECHDSFADPGASAADACSGDLSESIAVSGSVDANAPGVYTLTYTVSDASGNTSTVTRTVTVVDTTSPVITAATASPNVLWPPSHEMVTVSVVTVATDVCDSAASTRIISVSSNEPDATDWQILSDSTVNLRAEKMKKIDRIYTITVEASDAAGNTSTKTVTVTVPHDQGSGN